MGILGDGMLAVLSVLTAKRKTTSGGDDERRGANYEPSSPDTPSPSVHAEEVVLNGVSTPCISSR